MNDWSGLAAARSIRVLKRTPAPYSEQPKNSTPAFSIASLKELTNSVNKIDNWPRGPFGDLFLELSYGTAISRSSPSDYCVVVILKQIR